MTNNNNDYEMYAELVRRVKSGDENAFAEIYGNTKKLVYTTCYGILNNEQDAEDAMQETYISVYNGINELEGDMAFLPWLKRIAANKALDKCRGRKDTASYDDVIGNEDIIEGDDDLENLPEAFVLDKDMRDTLYKIMRKELSDDQFRTILLFYYDEMSVKDIASSMQCPENTIKTKLRLARVKIRNGIEKYEKENKISLMGGAFATAALGRFFAEYYGSVRIPAPKGLPFRIVSPKGGSAAGKAAAKTAGKAAAASAKTAAGASVAKTIGVVCAAVAGIASVTAAVIIIKGMLSEPDAVELNEYHLRTFDSVSISMPVIETSESTSETTSETTDTQPVDTKMTMEEAYLDVLAKYGCSILALDNSEQIYSTSSLDTCYTVNYIDIDDNGINELIFAYLSDREDYFLNDNIRLAIYTYEDDSGEAKCLFDQEIGTASFAGWSDVVMLDNGNILNADIEIYKNFSEKLAEIEMTSDNKEGVTVNSISAECNLSADDVIYILSGGDEYTAAYEDYQSRVVLPLMTFDYVSYYGIARRENSELAGLVADKANYYTFNDFVTFLGGDPATIFAPQDGWESLYLDQIGSFNIEDYADGRTVDLSASYVFYDLVYINADETPELAISYSDSSNDESCMIVYTIYDGQVIELYHCWYDYYSFIAYCPTRNLIGVSYMSDNSGYIYHDLTGINSECSASNYLGTYAVSYPGYLLYQTDETTGEVLSWKDPLGTLDDYSELMTTKSLLEITDELSN